MLNYFLSLIILAILFYFSNQSLLEEFQNNTITTNELNLSFKGQYLITKIELDIQNVNKIKYNSYNVYYGDNLDVNIHNDNLLIGFIIDPNNYKLTNKEILANIPKNKKDIFEFVKNKSGRFVIISNNIIFADASALRRIFYVNNSNDGFSSSEKILVKYLNIKENISSEKMKFINSSEFKYNESAWYGDEGYITGINIVLPNHYFNIDKLTVNRIPLKLDLLNNTKIPERIHEIIKNSIKALLYRNKKLILPITAGYDSRLLLSTTKEFKDQIDFYIFDSTNTNKVDPIMADNISKKFNLNFKKITINNTLLENDFKNKYITNKIKPRILPKTKNIEYHFYNSQNKININGNCAEILKKFFGNHTINNFDSFIKRSNVSLVYNNKYLNKSIHKWYTSIEKDNPVNTLDLFYWEQKQGLWGSLYPFEQDIAIEEFSPFNNRELLLLGIKYNSWNELFTKTIEYGWKDLLYQKFNPKLNEIIKN